MSSILESVERDKYSMINFEETELRLGLPGGGGNDGEAAKINGGKRGFSETVDLKLNLSSKESVKNNEVDEKMKKKSVVPQPSSNDPAKPPAK
jgi:auxin-responsive protein IAA